MTEEDEFELGDNFITRFLAKIPNTEKALLLFLILFMVMAYFAARRHDLVVADYNDCARQLNMLKNGTRILMGI